MSTGAFIKRNGKTYEVLDIYTQRNGILYKVIDGHRKSNGIDYKFYKSEEERITFSLNEMYYYTVSNDTTWKEAIDNNLIEIAEDDEYHLAPKFTYDDDCIVYFEDDGGDVRIVDGANAYGFIEAKNYNLESSEEPEEERVTFKLVEDDGFGRFEKGTYSVPKGTTWKEAIDNDLIEKTDDYDPYYNYWEFGYNDKLIENIYYSEYDFYDGLKYGDAWILGEGVDKNDLIINKIYKCSYDEGDDTCPICGKPDDECECP